MKSKVLVLAGVLFLVSGISSYGAEDAAGGRPRDKVKLERIVVTPIRMTQYDYKTTSDVIVIGREEIEASSARYISDILKETTGINVYDSSTEKTVRVDIRGFVDTSVSNILVLINGRKVNSIDISGPDWMQIPLETIERIEIVRGAGSVLYGDNAVGGVVNIITKKGEGKVSGKIGAKHGSYNMRQADAEISGTKDKISYYLYSKQFNTKGYRSNSDVHTKDHNARVGYIFSEDLYMDLMTGWHEDDYGLPGGLNDQGELAQYGRRGSPDGENYASTKDRYVQFSIDATPRFKDAYLGELAVDLSYRNRDAYSWFDYGVWGSSASKYMIDTYGINTRYMFDKYIFDREFNFVTGIDYYDVEHIIRGSGSGMSTSTDDLTIYKDEFGIYAYSEFELFNKLFINGGARYQKADYTFDQRKATANYETKNPDESVLMGGLKYEYPDGSILHFNVHQTFRFLATDEWYSTW
ncbi:MAG: TonB-dependent receptor plug domain-containing protein, partial [Candidatus Omnitrophica bacterium]|nr:TonB-dependent receptor plug domain-containing protein [Candidatus Omnitrophota bacterium]